MRKSILCVVTTLLSSSEALALPDAAPGTEGFCSNFEEAAEGVWVDPSGYETLLFRLSWNPDGNGCYAWFNAVPQWGIGSAGSITVSGVAMEGAVRSFDNGRIEVKIDLDAGSATYRNARGVTKGRLLP